MNTNINNKKFKLVSLRNQPMQAFSCKRECDKEASGDGERRRKGEHREIWAVGGWGGGGVTEGELEEGLRGNILRRGEKKIYDDPSSDFVLVLTTLKNRWTLFLVVNS